ncbi:MAG TPA: hypothetical protein VKK30_05540, partial [Actinomycetota bacterium]|nr:hypothetical protein [Actinomycetota bacterium]
SAPAYLGVAAFEFALLIGLGLASLFPGVGSLSFGRRHLGAGLMVALLAIGLSGQAVRAIEGSWIVGRGRIPAAYAVVKQSSSLPFRVLWVGRSGGQPFVAPGGVPDRNLSAGGTTIRFAVRLQSGASILDVGRPTAGRGYEALDRVLTDILAGNTQHGGALLAPFAISYIVASPGDLPPVAAASLRAQLDLDRFPTPGLIILRNEKAVPLRSVVQSPDWIDASRSGQPRSWIQLPQPNASPLSGTDERYSGAATSGPGLALLSQQFDGGWRLSGGGATKVTQPRRAFGWAVGFDTPSAAMPFTVRFGGRGAKRAEIALLAILWLTAIWMTRRPLRGR